MAFYAGYGNNIVLHGADALVIHRSQDPRVVIIEYEVHGKIVATGASYDNRFISVVTIENRKMMHWRDYMDSLTAMTALSQASTGVIGYCSTERPSDCILSIAAGANRVGLSFYYGATLPDPHKLLLGSGSQNRFIRIESAATLGRPEVEELIATAIAQAERPLPESLEASWSFGHSIHLEKTETTP